MGKTYVIWILLNFLVYVGGVTAAGQTYSGCLNLGDASGYRLRCPHGCIADVQLTSGVGSCREKDCRGLTSTLIVAQHQCYWQDYCDVEFPDDFIVKTSEFIKCMVRHPEFLEISGYSCFNQMSNPNGSKTSDSKLLNICADTDGHPRRASSSATYARSEGLIRSHDTFPWSYGGMERNCSLVLSRYTGHNLLVSVKHIDVGEHDRVTMAGTESWERRSLVNATSGTALEIGTERDSSFRFDFNVSVDSNAGSGFVICFKFYKPGENRGSQNHDVCEELFSKGVLELLPGPTPSTTKAPAAPTPPPTQASPAAVLTPEKCKRNKKGKCRKPKKPKCKKLKDAEERKKCTDARKKGKKGKKGNRKKEKKN